MKYKKNDIREDGFIFVGYRFRDGKMNETWESPEANKRRYLKKINPNTRSIRRPFDWPSKLRMGDTRPEGYPQDGMLFYGYKRNGIVCYEVWVTPERLAELRNPPKSSLRAKDYHAKQSATVLGRPKFIDELITNKQIREQAKGLVAYALKNGLMSKAA